MVQMGRGIFIREARASHVRKGKGIMNFWDADFADYCGLARTGISFAFSTQIKSQSVLIVLLISALIRV